MSFFTFVRDFFLSFVQYRDYLVQSVARDLRKRYRRSALGYLWSMLNPLLMMTILSVVFSNLMRASTANYPVFLFCGMLPWAYFSGTLSASLHAVKGNMQIISQLPVPKYIFILSLAFSQLFNYVVSLVPLVGVMWFLGVSITPYMLLMPLIILPLVVATLGVSLMFSVFNVFFDDTEHLIGVFLQGLYFLSPVLYSREILPKSVQPFVDLNPLFKIIEYSRDLILNQQLPPALGYLTSVIYCFMLLLIGLFIFKKADNKFIYYV
jgi:ABC-2 type transport system permease protein